MIDKSSKHLAIIHVSDLHFGSDHRFVPDKLASGSIGRDKVPELIDSLLSDLSSYPKFPAVLIAATGDFTCKATPEEFKAARQFLEGFIGKTICGHKISKSNIFIVPGNHDRDYTKDDLELAWQNYHSFYQAFYGSTKGRKVGKSGEDDFLRVHNRFDDLGAVIVELNSCMYVRKDTEYQNRGFIEESVINRLESELKSLPEEAREKAVKIAMLHHHPVLIPGLVESGREYDALHHAGFLLRALNDNQFHLILHGHKHQPYVFSYDATCGWHTASTHPLLVVAGGSASSTDLAGTRVSRNAYNFVNIRYSWSSKETTIRVSVKGLETLRESGEDLTKANWRWILLREIDRLLSPPPQKPDPEKVVIREDFEKGKHQAMESERVEIYRSLRGNMPVVNIVPSLLPGQEYQAQMKIVGHGEQELPVRVTYMAGENHDVCICDRNGNADFENFMAYYKGMLIKVVLEFNEGKSATTYMYAHLPVRS